MEREKTTKRKKANLIIFLFVVLYQEKKIGIALNARH